jgi:outer membrane protein TolC
MQNFSLPQLFSCIWRAGLILVCLPSWVAAEALPDLPDLSDQGALSVHAAVQAALGRSQALVASDASANAARDMAIAAAQQPDPVLKLGLNDLPVSGPDRFSTTADFMTMRSTSLMQTFTREDKRLARAARFEREADVALAERAMRSSEIAQQTASAWLQRHAQEQRVGLLKRQSDEARLQAEAAEAAARSGRGSSGDWIDARDAMAQAQQALLGAEAELTNARQALVRWTGGSPTQALGSVPAIDASSFSALPASEQHPELLAIAARENAALAEAEVARLEGKPDWTAELMFSQRGSAFSNMVSVAVSVPLQWDKPRRQDRVYAAQQARALALRAEREEATRARTLQFQALEQSWRSTLAQIAVIDQTRLPLAAQRTSLALAAYRGARGSLAEVLAARRTALALQLERIDLALAAGRLWAQLTYLMPQTPSPSLPITSPISPTSARESTP